jgi:hypothetical protein
VHALLIAAEEPSKVPFYIAGAVLVAWAVSLAVVGLTRPAFPFNIRGERAVIAVSLILVAVTIAMAVKTSAFVHA